MNEKLNTLLADLVIEAHKLQRLHWYVKGPDFFPAHKQLEEFYDDVSALVDDVAEAMLMCKIKPIATVDEFLKNTGISESKGAFVSSKEAFAEVADDFKHLLKDVEDAKEQAVSDGVDLIEIKCDGYIEYFSKAIWMLTQR